MHRSIKSHPHHLGYAALISSRAKPVKMVWAQRERDRMIKSRSKISRQPAKKSKKIAARTARAASRGKSRSAAARPAPSKTAVKGKKSKWVYAFGGGKSAGR